MGRKSTSAMMPGWPRPYPISSISAAAAIKLAETLVDLKVMEQLTVSRYLTYERATDEELERARKVYWERKEDEA